MPTKSARNNKPGLTSTKDDTERRRTTIPATRQQVRWDGRYSRAWAAMSAVNSSIIAGVTVGLHSLSAAR